MVSSFSVRSLTGAFFGFMVLGSIFLGPLVFALTMLLVQLGLMWEFIRLAGQMNANIHKPFVIMASVVLYLYMVLVSWGVLEVDLYLAAVAMPVFLLMLISEIFRQDDPDFHSLFFTLFALMYVTIPIAMLNMLYAMGNANLFPWELILGLFLMTWIYDTFAYIFGISFGKHKLFERVSPKKSWEGFWGGTLVTLGFAVVYSHWFESLNLWQWLLFAIIVIIFGTFGDLFESRLKRLAGIKDSGTILPGHGGLLDRFDAILFAAPAVWCLLVLFN
ncbi:MAG: phosphatidate cytidylyltransferase [Bacteroidales bacterium]|nr:phosphatidate cytidylyltransferase [Bacteroidales bacterium]